MRNGEPVEVRVGSRHPIHGTGALDFFSPSPFLCVSLAGGSRDSCGGFGRGTEIRSSSKPQALFFLASPQALFRYT